MKRTVSKKSVALLVSLLLLACAAVGGTIAFLTDETPAVVNEFTPAEVTTEVTEDRNGNVKSNVQIKNTGDIDAYIRAAVVVTWQDAQGNIYGKTPVAGTDYTISFHTDAQSTPAGQWVLANDGFYYWTEPVKSYDDAPNDCSTGVLIDSCTYTANAPEGYSLNVEIIGSGIQSVPSTVVITEWASGVSSINDTTLTIRPIGQ